MAVCDRFPNHQPKNGKKSKKNTHIHLKSKSITIKIEMNDYREGNAVCHTIYILIACTVYTLNQWQCVVLLLKEYRYSCIERHAKQAKNKAKSRAQTTTHTQKKCVISMGSGWFYIVQQRFVLEATTIKSTHSNSSSRALHKNSYHWASAFL